MLHKTSNIIIESCLIFLIIFTPLTHGTVKPWSIAVFEITALLMVVVWVFSMLQEGKLTFIKNPLTIIISLFIAYIFLQFLLPQNFPLTSLYKHTTKTELLKIIAYILIFFVLLNTITTKAQITRILSFLIGTGFVMSIFFLMRYFDVSAPRGIINPDHFAGYLSMIIPLSIGFFLLRKPCSAILFLT